MSVATKQSYVAEQEVKKKAPSAEEGKVPGTPSYLAPEQINAEQATGE